MGLPDVIYLFFFSLYELNLMPTFFTMTYAIESHAKNIEKSSVHTWVNAHAPQVSRVYSMNHANHLDISIMLRKRDAIT